MHLPPINMSKKKAEAVVRATLTTPPIPGAVAIILLQGDCASILSELTGRHDFKLSQTHLVDFADIDEGLVLRLSEKTALLMPHGGPRIVERLASWLIEHGATWSDAQEISCQSLFPEATDAYEALMLRTLAQANSRLAVDLLLDQPKRWRLKPVLDPDDLSRSLRLNRLIQPAHIALVGQPNAGKSSLMNALMGRTISIATHLPGTTRDYTTGLIDLAGVTALVHDTPGLRQTQDPIEASAIELAASVVARADLVVLLSAPDCGWLKTVFSRAPDITVRTMADIAKCDDADICISSETREGLSHLTQMLRERLVPECDLNHPGAWLFDPQLSDI